MDNPKIEIRKTKRYGKALFARQDIKKDEIVADWTGGRIYQYKKATKLPNDPPYFPRDHAIQFAEHKYIDYDGIGRYFAHSCNPNCGFHGKFKIVAMCDIKKGEELNFDYAMSEDSDWRLECKCGSKNCRKIISAFSLLSKDTIKKYNGYISKWLREKYKLK